MMETNFLLSDFKKKVLLFSELKEERRLKLLPLVNYFQTQLSKESPIAVHFICTHNSRRSQFAQIWMQVAAHHFNIPYVHCFSGGTEVTAVSIWVLREMQQCGLQVQKLCNGENPIYAVKYSENEVPVFVFSKKIESVINPINGFMAILTCAEANEACPHVLGAQIRISLPYDDPKLREVDEQLVQIAYQKTNLEIAREMFYVLSQLTR